MILWLWLCDWQIWFWTLNYFKHRVHRRLLQGDYTEYLKVQRIHRTFLLTTRQLVYTYNLSTQSNHNFDFWIVLGVCFRGFPCSARNSVCLRLLCHPCIPCRKWVPYLSLCKTDSYKGICGTCYSSTPKNDCFLNKVAYLCKQRTEAPPDLPERGGGKFASILQKLSEKESRALILLCAHRHSSPFGEAGWGSSSPRGEECRSRDCPKSFRS